MPSLKGTSFTTPLWCNAKRHALKRDNHRTPYLVWVRALDQRGCFLGVGTQCKACAADLPAEPASLSQRAS